MLRKYLIVLFFVCCFRAFAQNVDPLASGSGSIGGAVAEVNGGIVPEAAVVLRCQSPCNQESTIANETGGFEFRNLSLGNPYEVGIPASGFNATNAFPAEETDAAEPPEAPQPANKPTDESHRGKSATPAAAVGDLPGYGQQTKRILYIIPNFNAISVGAHLPPQTAKDKFLDATQDSFDYSNWVFIGILSGIGQAEKSTPEFHQGAVGYGRYYWHAFVDQADENYWVESFMPIVLRQDTRYYTLGRGGFLHRTFYAFSRGAITRSNSGRPEINYSEIVGAGASAGISNLYYPNAERTWTKTGQRWATNVGLDIVTLAFKEFWPDINHRILHRK